MKRIAIYGAGGLGQETETIIHAINSLGSTPVYDFIGYFDDHIKGENILGGLKKINEWENTVSIVIALGDPIVKQKIIENITNELVVFETLIHPSVEIGNIEKVSIGLGCILAAGVKITTNVKVHNHVLVNLNSTIGHDCIISSYCSIMPGVNIAGKVNVLPSVLLGSGSNILNGVSIGERARVGAGAVVTSNVAEDITVIGIPARPINK